MKTKKECPVCKGKGVVVQIDTGKPPRSVCRECNGTGEITEDTETTGPVILYD